MIIRLLKYAHFCEYFDIGSIVVGIRLVLKWCFFAYQIASPVKKISIVGSARDQPFRLSVRNSYDNKAPLSTNLSFDTDRRLINFETNYDLGKTINMLFDILLLK